MHLYIIKDKLLPNKTKFLRPWGKRADSKLILCLGRLLSSLSLGWVPPSSACFRWQITQLSAESGTGSETGMGLSAMGTVSLQFDPHECVQRILSIGEIPTASCFDGLFPDRALSQQMPWTLANHQSDQRALPNKSVKLFCYQAFLRYS